MVKQLYPPQPKVAIPRQELIRYEGSHVGQGKFNGAHNLIQITPDSQVILWNRHGTGHKIYSLTREMEREILELPGLKKGVEYWLDGELLVKTKAEDTKGKIVLFDILQNDRYLFMKPALVDRLSMLDEICGFPRELDPWRGMAYRISDNLLVAPTIEGNFQEYFDRCDCDELEGIVLKKKDSVLDNFGQKPYKVNWMVKCRRPHKNYTF